MTKVDPAELCPIPSAYQSSRELNDVLIGDDSALPLIHASSVGDIATLRGFLVHSPEIALESPHRIYQEDRPSNDENDVRGVLARKILNVAQAIFAAAENGHGITVSTLIEFASRNGFKPSDVILRETIKKTVANGHAAVFEVLVTAEPTVAIFDLAHGRLPLDLAIAAGRIEVARVTLQHGGGRHIPSIRFTSSYPNSRLSRAARSGLKDMTELLIQHGFVVKGSGALQVAAERNALDIIRFLVEEHGADVNERLPAETLPRVDNTMLASWTPMHFAARCGKEEAMKLLENFGAKTHVLDVNGRTPLRLLEEREEEIRKH